MKRIKIFLAIGNSNLQNAIQNFIETEIGCDVIGSVSCARELLNQSHLNNADIIVLDINLEDEDGFKVARQLLQNNYKLNILALSMNYEPLHLIDLVITGFKGCIQRNRIFDDMELALKTIQNNDLFFPKDIKL